MFVGKIVTYLLFGTLFTALTPNKAETFHCPSKCHCSTDFTAVKCRGFDQFPVLEFATDVRTLDLSRGHITDIEKTDLKAYENLQLLDIRYNEIKSVSPGLFSDMKTLRELLSAEYLPTVRDNFHLLVVYVANNPWSCDKSTLHVLQMELTALADKSSNLENFDGGKMECFDPPDMKGNRPLHLINPTMIQMHKVIKGRRTDQHQAPGGVIALSIFLVMLMSATICGAVWVFRENLLRWITNVWRRKPVSDPANKMEAGEMDNKNNLIDSKKKSHCMSQDLPASETSSESSLVNEAANKMKTSGQVDKKSIIIDSIKKMRRMSQGLPASHTSSASNSDDEPTDYLKERMQKQRRQSCGFAEGGNSCSEDESGIPPQ